MEEFSEELTTSYDKLLEKLSMWFDAIVLQIPNFAIAIIVAVFAYYLSSYIRKFAVKASSKITQNKTVLNLISNITAVFFSIVVLFMILGIFDLGGTINKILATAGVLGLAVGLALQDPMNNLFSGVFMSVRQLYKIGDLVETNDYFGTILNIDLRATTILLPSGQEVVIPNKEVIQKPLKNYSVSGQRRIDISCGVSYGEELETVEQVAVEAIKENIDFLKSKPVEVLYDEFGGSSINFKLRFWINSTSQADYLSGQSNAIKAIKSAFDANNITIPYPITTLDFGIKGGVPLKDMLQINGSKRVNGMKSEMLSNSN